MADNFNWLPKPKSQEEIPPYLEKLFKFAGQNLWTKILVPCIESELTQEIEKHQTEEAQKSVPANGSKHV